MKHSIRFATGALCWISLVGAGSAVRAQVVSDLTTSALSSFNGTTAAAQFHLNAETDITSASLLLDANTPSASTSNLSASLFSDAGGTLGTALGTSTGTSGTLSLYPASQINFAFNGQDLASGTYWLELSGSDAGNVSWEDNSVGITNTGSGGVVNMLGYDNFDGYQSFGALMSIDGHAPVADTSTTPEPGSIALLVGMGISGAGFAARRRRRV